MIDLFKISHRRFSTSLRSILPDERGVVISIIALSVIPIFVTLALAIDLGRGYLVKSKLSYAIDAAALAGGRAFETSLRDDDITMFFNANFPDGYMGATLADNMPNVVINSEDNTITIDAKVNLPTRFMGVAGVHQLTVAAHTVVKRELRGMELALVMDNTGSMRASNKIGAMKDAAKALVNVLYGDRDQIANFWVSVVPYTATVNIGNQNSDWLVSQGYDSDAAWLAGDPDSSERFGYHPNHYAPSSWKGCVEARDYPNDSNDTPPDEESWYPFLWRTTTDAYLNPYHVDSGSGDNDDDDDDDGNGNGNGNGAYHKHKPATWGPFLNGDNEWNPNGPVSDLKEANSDENQGTGPNLGCGPAITPLVSSKTTVISAIDDMLPWHRGGTMSNLGLAWGWRVLSPRWQGFWGGDDDDELPLDYETPNMHKVVILLTDGENQWYDWPGHTWKINGHDHYSGLPGFNKYKNSYDDEFKDTWPGADYTAYGRINEARLGTASSSGVKTEINDRMLELCEAMKNEGITIYTITFRLGDIATRNLYENCATSEEHFFNSPSNADLQQTFVEIANELSYLRIAE